MSGVIQTMKMNFGEVMERFQEHLNSSTCLIFLTPGSNLHVLEGYIILSPGATRLMGVSYG